MLSLAAVPFHILSCYHNLDSVPEFIRLSTFDRRCRRKCQFIVTSLILISFVHMILVIETIHCRQSLITLLQLLRQDLSNLNFRFTGLHDPQYQLGSITRGMISIFSVSNKSNRMAFLTDLPKTGVTLSNAGIETLEAA